jgi:hypothetical protein
MSGKPILLYSNHCGHCHKFLEILSKNPDIRDAFEHINIDIDARTRRRPDVFFEIQRQINTRITQVPTIIVVEQDQLFCLTGEQAFDWLDRTLQSQLKSSDINPFNPNEMGSFSDPYAPLQSNSMHDASSQSFKFVHMNNDTINTPECDRMPFQKPQTAQGMDRRMHQTANYGTQRLNSHVELGTKNSNEMEKKYAELLQERDYDGTARKRVTFQ